MGDEIQVVLADDHPALRLGLRVLLDQAPDIRVIAETGNGQQALALIQELQPDVAVLDCKLPEKEGAEVAIEIARQELPVRVLALSAYDEEGTIRRMLEAGAAGYLMKDEAPETIVAAVRAVSAGESYFSAAIAAKMHLLAAEQPPTPFTERERAVLRLIAKGLGNKQIAVALRVTERTVEFHVSNILRKLNVRSRVEAALWAREQGVLP